MEAKSQHKLLNERFQMAHKLETPHEMNLSLRESAEKIGSSEPKKLVESLVIFKQNVFDFMKQFDLEINDFTSNMDNKRVSAGGFKKRAVQEHSFKGINGLRLVRDNRSEKYLKEGQDDLYLNLLNRKLEEETKELVESMSIGERIEELGDVFEVFNSILDARGISPSLVEGKRQINELNARREKKRKLAKKK